MAKNKQTRKLRIATLMLSAVMTVAAGSFFLTACSDKTTEDDSSTTETRTDTQTFANGNFEYFSDNDGGYLIGSPENWTSSAGSNSSSVSASSSVAKSGIVDTSKKWSVFSDAYDTYTEYKDADDDAELPDPYYTDIDNNYDIPGWDLAKAATEDDKDPDADAIKAAAEKLNPGTPFAAKETEDEENGTHVLMLHNYRSNKLGTAARYTSSTITLAAGTAAKISVWVKTSNMTFDDGKTVNGNRGAYIRINNTVGGVSQDPLTVKNIDTSSVTENNGWEQYTFYLNASPYATTTFSVELGLGVQAEGQNSNYLEYVQGYAFFDGLEYTVMKSADFATEIAENVAADQQTSLNLSFGSDLQKFDANKVTSNAFSLNLDSTQLTKLAFPANVTVSDTENARGYTVESYPYAESFLNSREDDKTVKSGVKNVSDFDDTYSTVLTKAFEKYSSLPFGDSKVLLLYSSKGAPYTATVEDSAFSLAKDEYMILSFWVKTSDLRGGTGATISVIDGETKTSIGAVDTTTLTTVDLVDDSKKESTETLKANEDIFDGWQRCFFFVNNTTDGTLTFKLAFSFGTSEFTETTTFTPGFAAFSDLSYTKVSKDVYDVKTTGTYAVEVSLKGSDVTLENSFDSEAYTDTASIENSIANLRNYKGVYGNSTYVGGEKLENDAQNGINGNKQAGVINKEYAKNYAKGGTGSENWMDILTSYPTFADAVTAADLWNNLFGDDCIQPLLIANTAKQAYGFIANSSTSIAASSYKQVTLRLKLSPGATATVYLIDSSDKDFGERKYQDQLTFSSGISYRYDADGNVVNLDPSDDAFSSKTNTVFYLQSNGLWSTTKAHTGGVYYANLANYGKDDDKNLIDSDGNIVYYASDEEGTYYRYKEDDKLSVAVKDFSAAGVDLAGTLLQSAPVEKALSRQVSNPSATEISDWIYVRFFIHTGSEAKDYRLEVWSGSRDASIENEANSFVVYDLVSYSDLDESSFNSLRDENLTDYAEAKGFDSTDELLDAYKKAPADYNDELVYFHYSLYDDDDYKSYDASRTDESDPYADYDASTYSDMVAYFDYKYQLANEEYYDTYVDYSAYEQTVTSSSSDETEDEDDTTNEPTYNVWLLVSSIVLAAALIFTLLALLIRKLLSNIRVKGSKKSKPMYDNTRKRYIRKLKLEESEHDEMQDDVLPEEDEISEEEIYKVEEDAPEASEEKSEQPAEEPAETSEKNDGEENK